MIKGIHHVALVVRDLAVARDFYSAVAGMAVCIEGNDISAGIARIEPGQPAVQSSLLAGRNGYLLMIEAHGPLAAQAPEPNPINRAGFRHFCIQNHDCALLEHAVLSRGGHLIAPPLDLGTGNQYAYARDGEGNIMEIEGLPYAPAAEPTWLAHVALVTRDMDRATAFYTVLLGRSLKSRGHFGPKPQLDRMGGLRDARLEGAWLPAGNMQLELWQFHQPPSPAEPHRRQLVDPGFSWIGLESTDLDADAAHLETLGGTVLGEPLEEARHRSLLACDPEGNVIKLLHLRENGAALSLDALADPAVCIRVEAGR